MTSIRQIQSERVLQDVVHTLYSQGVNPLLAEVFGRVSTYFSNYKPGKPLPVDLSRIQNGEVSNVEDLNEILEHTLLNMDVLYETSIRQVDDIMLLNDALYDNLERLRSKQKRLESRVNDYLLMNNNSEGHFLVVSDNFSNLAMTSLPLTSARVDTEAQMVYIPSLSSHDRIATNENVGNPSISVTVNDKEVGYSELAPFSGAIETSSKNILWAIEVETSKPEEVIVTVDIPLYNGPDPLELSRIDLTPYSGKPTQIWFEMQREDGERVPFGRRIQSAITKLSMSQSPELVTSVRLYMRKTEQDYIETRSGSTRYKYVFGARSIAFMFQSYERNATFVSGPILMPDDMRNHSAIDAVSLDTIDNIPDGTNIQYYVAAESLVEGESLDRSMEDFSWRRINPIRSRSPEDKVVRFNGALLLNRMIRLEPSGGDLQLLPEMPTGPLADRNPSPTIIEGVDIYRIAELEDDPIRDSLVLLEGVNTTRITSRNTDSTVQFDDLDLPYWASMRRDEPGSLTVDYGRIDAGNEFFYGGDIGASGKDVMVEAFVECDTQFETFLSEIQKVDARSRLWDMKAYLNGRQLGVLESGTNSARVPWGFRQGLNHVVLIIRIPLEAAQSHPYMGAISLMGGEKDLQSFGLVRLERWNYVDLFTMRYNETGEPKTFTVHNGEIICRRKPTDNFQLRYALKTGLGPNGIRLRADLSRSRNTPNVTPKIESYTLRFGYGSA